MTVRLTELAKGAGCGCKIGPAQLRPIVAGLPRVTDPDLLIGAATADDAAVYRLTSELAIVQTVDFFTPIVDDPYDFGRIAATNAISDVYAMGATPVMALNIVAFSLETLGAAVLSAILRGGADVAVAAGAALAGGHTIDDREPKYGMAVTGLVHPAEVLSNAGARAGDALVLTKPVGAGLITTGAKHGIADDASLQAAIDVMTQLNREASVAARRVGAHALTDVTGFGLLGHLHELALASGLAAEVSAAAVPAIAGALALADQSDAIAGGTRRNRADADTFTAWDDEVPEPRRWLLCDAMTSGGLLAAVPGERAVELPGVTIGRLLAGEPGTICVGA